MESSQTPSGIAPRRGPGVHATSADALHAGDALRSSPLTAMLAHDLRSHLCAVQNNTDFLLEDDTLDERVGGVLADIAASTAAMRRLVEDLLDIERGDGSLPVRREAVVLGALVHEAMTAVKPFFAAREQGLELDLRDELVEVHVDPMLLGRVLANLLDNASKYAPEHSTVRVVAHLHEDAVELVVIDRGPGIAFEHRERVFEPYERVESQPRGRGWGLGLAFCKIAVLAQGGTIWVEAPAEGGTAVHVVLPKAVQHTTG